MGRKSKNWHPHNPNGRKTCKINAIWMVSLQIKKAMTVEHPCNYMKLCWVKRGFACWHLLCRFHVLVDCWHRLHSQCQGLPWGPGKVRRYPYWHVLHCNWHLVLQETIIGVFHQCLYFRSQMEESLINPNQLWANSLIVDNVLNRVL